MKRLLCLLMCVAMVLGVLSGCSHTEPEQEGTSPSQPTEPTSTMEPAPDYNRLVDVSGEEARTAILAEGTLELAAQLPDAAWNSLPKWNGVTIPNMQQPEPYDGEPLLFSREDMKSISELGFNFVRIPLDTRLFFDLDDPGKVHLGKLVNLDELISWGAEFGIHVCLDVHNSFGFFTHDVDAYDTMWENPEEQEIFLSFWDMLADRYKEVPSNLLSFNLMNEPTWGITEEQYVEFMRRNTERIRAYTPNRLIFVDMMNTAKDPIYSLVEDQVAQAFHFYEPNALTHTTIHDNFDFGGAYPVISSKGFISQHVGPAEFVIEGSFPAGTKVGIIVDEVHMGGTISLTADGQEVFSNEYDYDAVGEDGCIYLYEEGTTGEYRGYDNTFEVVLSEDTSVLRLQAAGDIYWFNLSKMYILTGEKQYMFEQNLDSLPEGTTIESIPNPHIIINEDGTITDEGNILFKVVDGAYIHDKFAEYAAFSEETGVAVMMQEFGVYFAADYGLTLEYLNDLLEAANANGLNWCGWDYFGPFNFYSVIEERRREGATYEEFSNGWIATEMLEVYQDQLTQ